jgi:predicted DNA-binding protein (UPF0251 family)
MEIKEQDYLAHYGTPRKSGRYPWGSGDHNSQRNKSFLDQVESLRKNGVPEGTIADGMGMTIAELRAGKSVALNQQRMERIAEAERLHDKGLSHVAAAKQMGIPESTFRSLLDPSAKIRADTLQSTSNMLKEEVDGSKHGGIDVGKGVENHLGISKEKLDASIAILKEQGYELHTFKQPQLGTTHETNRRVLAKPGSTQKEFWMNPENVSQLSMVRKPTQTSEDGGRTYFGLLPPIPVSLNRVGITYKEQGGDKADGVIYVRPGAKDLSLGKSNYAQVRIQAGPGHYIKGMAMYKDGLPDGIDLQFNTNKSDTGKKTDALKPLKTDLDGTIDKDNPFGAVVKQIRKLDKDGKPIEKLDSAMNIVQEEGDWGNWSKTLASQVLSKQSPKLAKTQLDMTYEERENKFKEISALTNPTVKRKLLEDLSGEIDTAAVDMKAKQLPRQGWHAILPIPTMPPNQIHAPNYKDGETVVLIRYPHGGTFEIPELTVNNSHAPAKRMLGNARDAVGIHHSVAERLSGADFDGDTVLVIPNDSRRVKTTPALKGLEGFDAKVQYRAYEGMKKISPSHKQNQMGVVSNLITDMTIRNASQDELARAIRHSMVIIDAENHNLDYKRSYRENGITELMKRYQSGPKGGASTLLSQAGAKDYPPEFKERPAREGGPIDKKTGERVFVPTGRMNKAGEPRVKKVKRLSITPDAHTLSSGTPMETLYANHSNKLKGLSNKVRLEQINTPALKYSRSAAKVYANEVASLNNKLNLAKQNAPLERHANALANEVYKSKLEQNPHLDKERKKRAKYQALEEMRRRVGAKKHEIKFTDAEWDAIQAGAISDSRLSEMLTHADMKRVHDLATPKTQKLMTTTKTNRAAAMLASGYTREQVADQLGVSLSTLDNAIHGGTS